MWSHSKLIARLHFINAAANKVLAAVSLYKQIKFVGGVEPLKPSPQPGSMPILGRKNPS